MQNCTNPTQLYRAHKTAQIHYHKSNSTLPQTKLCKFVTNILLLRIVSWTKCAVICMWGLLLPHCNDCASKLLPTRANIGTQQCIVLADICVLANWWTRQIHAVLADFCVLVYWWTGELDITLQHWQIHAALAAISQSWWRGREGRGLCFLITSKCSPCRWMLMIAAIMRWRKNLRLQNWCKGLLVLVIVIKRTVF